MKKIGIVLGSTRKNRLSPQVAAWVLDNCQTDTDVSYELIDLADFQLPLFDEPNSPKAGLPYEHEHTRVWAAKVAEYAGFIFVFPEYNGSYPAVLKNALDYLYQEWSGKPAGYVSYGFGAGSRAAAAFDLLMPNLELQAVAAKPGLTLTPEIFAADGSIADPNAAFESQAAAVAELSQQLNAAVKAA